MRSASDIKKDILDELSWALPLDAAGIGVAVADGAVTLSGHVRSYSDRREAEKAAKRVKGVVAVANELEVRLPSSLQRDDSDIAAAVSRALKWDVNVPDGVTATVRDGWVSLEGEVDWDFQRRAAEKAIRNTMGVRGISNLIRLRVRPRPKDVSDAIHRAFQRSAQIDADQVRVNVEDDKVVLRGSVRSWSERTEAEHAARAAPGVREVVNELVVNPWVASAV